MLCSGARVRLTVGVVLALVAARVGCADSANQPPGLLNDLVDVSSDFRSNSNEYYLADRVARFDPGTGQGQITWLRNQIYPRMSSDNMENVWRPFAGINVYEPADRVNPTLPFSLEFITSRTVRIRIQTKTAMKSLEPSLMLAGEPPRDTSWKLSRVEGGYRYSNAAGSVTVLEKPWHLEFRDPRGNLLTKTDHSSDNEHSIDPVLPFAFIRRTSDYSQSVAAVFTLAPAEKLFGCGESFTRLDKRGQKMVLWVNNANGVETSRMYKPIPFFLSSRGYGMFVHTAAPATFDLGFGYSGLSSLMLGDDQLDLFFFFGSPKEILGEYTALTGRPPMPPLWSFGFWMSRNSYQSDAEVREVAAKLRQNRIPADVIHIDAGWYDLKHGNDLKFAAERFPDPRKLFADLKRDGFRVSLWQMPYYSPVNSVFPELVNNGLAVPDGKGNVAFEDAILDFSNPAAVAWYQGKLAELLRMGAAAIKVDFGESAPMTGLYASGLTGFYEHNLYPLRYNKAVADITRETTGENIIWARSAWAGSQRYPIHWGGDGGSTDTGMAATLRGGLSLGLSGFTFWSHDIGGYAGKTPEELYRRWLPFGMLSSHSRSHGMPPKEPWLFSPAFTEDFRRAAELKYRLMPYVYAQAMDSSDRGLPMVRALFIEYPDDPGAWEVDNEYLFGSDILVAPLMESGTTGRHVYLPQGQWIDYQSHKSYPGGWHKIEAGLIPVVMLVRDGSAIPEIKLAQSTSAMDWSQLDVVVFSNDANAAHGLLCLPSDQALREVDLTRRNGTFELNGNPLAGKVALVTKIYTQ
ncbi:MAG: TIM-barrel domain-containing protein [Bryobacteraceae bacterium]